MSIYHPSGITVEIVGIEANSNGRSCYQHDVCGALVEEDVVLRLRKVQILNSLGREEPTIAAYHVSDGIDQCRVGFLQRHIVAHARQNIWWRFGTSNRGVFIPSTKTSISPIVGNFEQIMQPHMLQILESATQEQEGGTILSKGINPNCGANWHIQIWTVQEWSCPPMMVIVKCLTCIAESLRLWHKSGRAAMMYFTKDQSTIHLYINLLKQLKFVIISTSHIYFQSAINIIVWGS